MRLESLGEREKNEMRMIALETMARHATIGRSKGGKGGKEIVRRTGRVKGD